MIRISVTGPESTGKSWLARQLAEHYQTRWVPEYARKYLEDIDRPYTYNDILLISQKQFEEEKQDSSILLYQGNLLYLLFNLFFCLLRF